MATFSTESYFQTQRPPAGLADKTARIQAFVDEHARRGTRVVLVTSGGTTVPLESNTVRFLDNFSAGTRGATSAEYFLASGYAVIFLHRLHSLRPFSRHYSHSLNPFLDLLVTAPAASPSTSSSDSAPTSLDPAASSGPAASADSPSIFVSPDHARHLSPILAAYTASKPFLLSVDFTTVNDYLFLLRAAAACLAPLGRAGLFYLAAAVSDFFLPDDRVAEHKIQSTHGSLELVMDQVPKVLRPLVHEWTPEGYIVSFKLETDPQLLVPKARAALTRYGHQLVVGNLLHTRKHEVVFVEPAGGARASSGSGSGVDADADADTDEASLSGAETPPLASSTTPPTDSAFCEIWLRLPEREAADPAAAAARAAGAEIEIEKYIIAELLDRHARWIDAAHA
ncbi:Phosphopantothenate--cysteine ligase cab2 [Cryptotrichosporon argae]